MQNNTTQDNKKQPATYIKPAITAYAVTTIRQALGPAVGFSGGRVEDEAYLLFEE